MTEKVKLPREVVNALDEFRSNYSGYECMVMSSLIRDPEEKVSHAEIVVKDFAKQSEPNFLSVMKALINGYEVEQTPEDKVREQYNTPRHFVNKGEDTDVDIYRKGIKFALDTLGIKIEGVNA